MLSARLWFVLIAGVLASTDEEREGSISYGARKKGSLCCASTYNFDGVIP